MIIVFNLVVAGLGSLLGQGRIISTLGIGGLLPILFGEISHIPFTQKGDDAESYIVFFFV